MKKWIFNLLVGILSAVFLAAAVMVGVYFWDAYVQQSRYEALADMRPASSRGEEISDLQGETLIPTTVEITHPKTGKTITILAEFQQLLETNGDFVGWMTVPGTKIDYPVMQTPDDEEFYLSRNFDKKKSQRGCLFVNAAGDVFTPSDNVIVYGHHMKDGTMFGQLDKFRKKAFWQEHRYLYFDTLQELHTYEIFAVLRTTASIGEGFAYHQFVNAQDAEEFDGFVAECKALALYDTDVDVVYGDKLLCLSTCEYSQTNGRLVVVAKRID